MKTPDPTITAESSAPCGAKFNGTFPPRHDTVIAEVLCRLVSGEKLTGMDAVFNASTTRLSAFVFRLSAEYGWTIDHTDRDVGTKDGRVTWIRVYHMSQGAIHSANSVGGAAFCKSVVLARASRRKGAMNAKAQASARNARRDRAMFDPRQMSLLGGAE